MGNTLMRGSLALVGWLVAAAAVGTAPETVLRFLDPVPDTAVFGETVVRVEVSSEEVLEELELWLDGQRVGDLEGPLFELVVDVGDENREHRFEAIARTSSGAEFRAERVTPAVRIDSHVNLDLKQIFVTVEDRRGERVLGLGKQHFSLQENRKEQEIITLESGDIPFSAVLLLDASRSMRESQMKAVTQGARSLVEGMMPFDEARLMVFTEQPIAASAFTSDPDELIAVIPPKGEEGGTAIYDHLFWATHQLKGRLGRRVVILLSDGIDVHSVLPMDAVAEEIQRAEASLYLVQILSPRDREENPQYYHSFLSPEEIVRQEKVLRKAVKKSGGRVLEVFEPAEIVDALTGILKELRDQYAIGFYPTSDSSVGGWRNLTLKAKGQGLELSYRKGYYVPEVSVPSSP